MMSTSHSTPSDLSISENVPPPDATQLGALLSQITSTGSYDVEFNSRDSTPLIMLTPPKTEHYRSVAQAARIRLVNHYGQSAADEIRGLIPSKHYWKTEAIHFAEYWKRSTECDSPRFARFRRVTTDEIRCLISDKHYWDAEVMHYRRYASGTKTELSAMSSKRPSGMCKTRKSQRTTLKKTSEDGPVSSRLRSRRRIKKKRQT